METVPALDRLIAIEEICRLKARRDRAVDTKDWKTYEALHVPEHRSHNDGFDAWSSAAEVVANTSAIMEGRTSVHHSHTPLIDIRTPTEASGVWGMQDYIVWKQDDEDHWLQGFGFYHETYEKRGGEWLFTSRRLERLLVETSPGAEFGAARLAAAAGQRDD